METAVIPHPFAHLTRNERAQVLGYVIQARKAAEACLSPEAPTDYGALHAQLTTLLYEAALPHQLDALVDTLWSPVTTLGLMQTIDGHCEPTRSIPANFPGNTGSESLELTNPDRARKPRLSRKELTGLRDQLRLAEETLSLPPSAFKNLIANPETPALEAKISATRPAYNLQMGFSHNRWKITGHFLDRETLGDIVGRTYRYLHFLQENHPTALENLYQYAHKPGEVRIDRGLEKTFGVQGDARMSGAFLPELLKICIIGTPETGFRQPAEKQEIAEKAAATTEQLTQFLAPGHREPLR